MESTARIGQVHGGQCRCIVPTGRPRWKLLRGAARRSAVSASPFAVTSRANSPRSWITVAPPPVRASAIPERDGRSEIVRAGSALRVSSPMRSIGVSSSPGPIGDELEFFLPRWGCLAEYSLAARQIPSIGLELVAFADRLGSLP